MIDRISVIMGIYNCEQYLDAAIESLLSQSFQDFKIIMCDDGSVDGTYMIAKKYASAHSNITLLKNEKNLGLNASLNRCIEYADTEFIARMDADDISLPDRFMKQVSFLDTHLEISFVSSGMRCFDDSGAFGDMIISKKVPEANDFIRTSPFYHAPTLFRTSALKEVGGYTVDRKLLRVEDYHLWFKLYKAGYKGYNMDDVLYMVREDCNAVSRRNFRNRLNECYVKLIGYKMIGISWYFYPFCIEPIVKYLAPKFLYNHYHKKNILR